MADPRDKFVELAQKRVNRAIKDIRLIGNLSNRSNYRYSQEDVRAIFSTLERELRDARERFSKQDRASTEKPFHLNR